MINLAIKGHATRGSEVIEILKMLGGTNRENCWGVFENRLYLINAFGDIEDRSLMNNSNYQIYTLEEFLKKFPHKVGDKVCFSDDLSTPFTINKMWWDENANELLCSFVEDDIEVPVEDLQPYKEETMEENIKEKDKSLEDLQPYKDEAVLNKWSGLKVELELSKSVVGVSNVESIRGEKFMSGFVKAIIPPEGYQFLDEKGNVINTTKIVLEKKKNEYPKTYEECYDEYNTELHFIYVDKDERDLYESFIKLIRCRNTYWKIAGEEMGLGKPWEPDWKNPKEAKYGIINNNDGRCESTTYVTSMLLAFPTPEMRDAFYVNFKDIIENCKELL